MAVRRIDAAERRARLAVRHRHVAAERTDDVEAIADGLVALHSSDPVSVYLSAAARMVHPSLAAVDDALYGRRSLLRHHAMRRTLWVVGHDTARLVHHGATRAIARVQRRNLLQMLDTGGVARAEEWLAAASAQVGTLLSGSEPLTAQQVGAQLPELTIPLEVGGAHTRVLLLMGFDGDAMRARPTGTWINGQYRWTAAGTWFPPGFGELDVRDAAAGLARRWLAAFGPGTRTDLAWWMGWTVRTTTQALADISAMEVELAEGTGYVLPDDVDAPAPAPPSAALLPGLDPSTMGWKQRGFHLDPADAPLLFDRNGNGGPTAWVDGRVVGGWHQRRDGSIALHVPVDVGTAARAALQDRADTIAQLLGDVRFTVRFPSPLVAQLA